MKIRWTPFDRHNRDIIRQQRVHRGLDGRLAHLWTAVLTSDHLTGGMNTGVGAAGECRPLIRKLENRENSLQLPLHRAGPRLDLRSGKTGAVVADGHRQPGHRLARR